MNEVFAAALELQNFCQDQNWKFCFIGGVAVQRWGEPRFTNDADLTLLTGLGEEERFIKPLLQEFTPRRPDAFEFALRNRVLLLKSANGVGLDVALGAVPFERRSIERATPFKTPDGSSLLTCSAEDLIVHKTFAGRPQDWIDVERIISRQVGKLDIALIRRELSGLEEVVGGQLDLARLEGVMARSQRAFTRIKPHRPKKQKS